MSKQLSTLLRHGHLPREEDGAIEFWRIKEYLGNHVDQSQHWSDEKWKSTMAEGGGNKKRFQYCTDPSGQEIIYLRALQGHYIGLMKSGRVQWQKAEVTRKDFNIALTRHDKKFFISELCKVIQDAISLILLCRTMYLFRTTFLQYIYHVGCSVNLHSIMNSGLRPGGQNLSKRQTVFFTSMDPINKEHQDPDEINLNAPRLVW